MIKSHSSRGSTVQSTSRSSQGSKGDGRVSLRIACLGRQLSDNSSMLCMMYVSCVNAMSMRVALDTTAVNMVVLTLSC